MPRGDNAGRPRKHPYPAASGQIAIDAEFQELADNKTEAIEARKKYGNLNQLHTVIDDDDNINSRIATIIIATREIAKNADVNDLDSLYACLEDYMRLCVEHNIRITNSGVYAACGLSRFEVKEWALGRRRGVNPEYKEFAMLLRSVCYENREMLMAEGKIHPVVGIWWQKNYDGFRDQPENYDDDVDKDDDTLSASEIADKYANIGDD